MGSPKTWEEPVNRRFGPLTLSLAIGASACSVSHGVRPIGDGVTGITATVGGPMVDYYGSHKPLPLSTVGVVHGLSDTVDLHAAVNWSTLALFGLFGTEIGAGWMFLEQKGARPALMGDLSFDLFAGDLSTGAPDGGVRVFNELDLRASWAWGKQQHLIYTGPSAFIQPFQLKGVPSWSLGHQFRFRRFDLSTEARWLAPFDDNEALTVDYAGLGKAGALSLQLGGRYRFGGPK